jgi:hypothetical protein
MPVNSSNFGQLLMPGLRKIYGLNYVQYSEEYSGIFRVETSTKAFEEALSVTAFGAIPEKPQGESVSYGTPKQNWKYRLTHVTYGYGFIVTREMMEDDQYGLIKRFPAALARSVRHTVETLGANILNRAFNDSYVGGDGLELCSTAHLLGGGGTWQNEPTDAVDLGATSLEQALVDIAAWTDDAGLKIRAMPKKLVVPQNLAWTASKLLESTLEPESAQNAVNPGKGIVPWEVNHYLTDTDAWFIVTDVPEGLVFYWRRRPEFSQDSVFDSENAKFKTTFRCIVGWDDPRGIYGCPGG